MNIKVRSVTEIILVFSPAMVVILFGESWAGENPILRQAVIWVGYIVMLMAVLGSLYLRHEGWSTLGLSFHFSGWKGLLKPLGQSLVVFLVATFAFAIGAIIMANIVGIPEGADFGSYNFLKGNLALLLLSLVGVYIVSSFGEEVLYRGFLMARTEEIVGNNNLAVPVSILVSTVVFGLIHYDWGITGMVQTGFMGFALAVAYIKVKRNLWVNVLAHAYMDTFLLVQLYLA